MAVIVVLILAVLFVFDSIDRGKGVVFGGKKPSTAKDSGIKGIYPRHGFPVVSKKKSREYRKP